jgi:hypothetical protein
MLPARSFGGAFPTQWIESQWIHRWALGVRRFWADKDGQYHYYLVLRDPLGNTRVTFSDLNNDDKINEKEEVIQINNYYAFGLNFLFELGMNFGFRKQLHSGMWISDFGNSSILECGFRISETDPFWNVDFGFRKQLHSGMWISDFGNSSILECGFRISETAPFWNVDFGFRKQLHSGMWILDFGNRHIPKSEIHIPKSPKFIRRNLGCQPLVYWQLCH